MAMTDVELQKLGELLGTLGLQPNVESAEGLGEWLLTHGAAATEGEKKEATAEEVKEDAAATKVVPAEPPAVVKQEEGVKEPVVPPQTVQVPEQRRREDEVLFNRMEVGRPRISMFSGSTAKDSTPFDVWRYEVTCLLADRLYSPDVVMETVRRNVKGDAARVVMRLGPRATVGEVLRKMGSIYGQVASQGALLSSFHAAQQTDSENVSEWSCRLEELMQQVEENSRINRCATREMLRSKLWSGLRSAELKSATRHKFDTLMEVDELLVAIRATEHEVCGNRVKSHVMSVEREPTSSERLEKTMQQIAGRLERMEKEMTEIKAGGRPTSGGGAERAPYASRTGSGALACFKCGQVGHIAVGCRQPGNAKPPLPEGRQ